MADIQRLDTLDQSVRLAIYRSFVETGNAPESDRLAQLVESTPPEIEASLHRLAEDHVLVLETGRLRIQMAMPFSAAPTAFRVSAGRSSWFANCAWDALGIPAALGADARIDTACADCGEAVQLRVAGGNLADDRGVIHFAVPAAHWWDDIRFT